MPETPQVQFSRVRTHIFWKTRKRALRTFLLFRPFVNTYLALSPCGRGRG